MKVWENKNIVEALLGRKCWLATEEFCRQVEAAILSEVPDEEVKRKSERFENAALELKELYTMSTLSLEETRLLSRGFIDTTINEEGVAVLRLDGPAFEKMSFWDWYFFGGFSTQELGFKMQILGNSDFVNTIILDINSPGGEAAGVENTSRLIRGVRSQKDVISIANNLMASAAFWIGTAANEVVLASRTSQTGSVGTIITHRDVSEANKKRGIKITHITAGEFKAAASPFAPLDEKGHAILNDLVNQVNEVFIDELMVNTGKSREEIMKFADGRTFLGDQAIKLGLASRIVSLADLVTEKTEKVKERSFMPGENPQPVATINPAEITAEYLREKFPQVYQGIFDAGKKDGMAAGVKTERDRIVQIDSMVPTDKLPAKLGKIFTVMQKAKQEGQNAGDVALALVKGGLTFDQAEETPKPKGNADLLQQLQSEAPEAIDQKPVDDDNVNQEEKDIEDGASLLASFSPKKVGD